LVGISQAYLAGDKQKAAELIKELKDKYEVFIRELFSSDEGYEKSKDLIDYHFNLISSFESELFTPIEEKVILAQGELISTTLFHYYLNETGVRSRHLPALDFMKIDEDNESVIDYLAEHLKPL